MRSPKYYLPLLRGKQNELVFLSAVRGELEGLPVVPIIEPVRAKLQPLVNVLHQYQLQQRPLGVIINPAVGDFASIAVPLQDMMRQLTEQPSPVFPVLRTNTPLPPEEWMHLGREVAILQDGPDLGVVQELLAARQSRVLFHVIDMDACPEVLDAEPLAPRILLKAGFEKHRTKDYPLDQAFLAGPGRQPLSGEQGWGDYMTLVREVQKGGGVPHALVIHVSYYCSAEGGLRVRRYLSDSNDSRDDPGGKFAEALSKLMADLEIGQPDLVRGQGIQEFRSLYERRSFPGHGRIKLFSMLHHFETVVRHCLVHTASAPLTDGDQYGNSRTSDALSVTPTEPTRPGRGAGRRSADHRPLDPRRRAGAAGSGEAG